MGKQIHSVDRVGHETTGFDILAVRVIAGSRSFSASSTINRRDTKLSGSVPT